MRRRPCLVTVPNPTSPAETSPGPPWNEHRREIPLPSLPAPGHARGRAARRRAASGWLRRAGRGGSPRFRFPLAAGGGRATGGPKPTLRRRDHGRRAGHYFVDGYAAGSRRAADAGLPMLLVFQASWCRWSGELVAGTLADARLAGLSGRFVAVSVDADRDAATCRSFGVQIFPTAIVLDRDRRERFRASGLAAREGLAVAVEAALDDTPRRIASQPAPPPR